MFPLLGTIIYVVLLLVNAMAVLSEDRFLARSELFSRLRAKNHEFLTCLAVGWSSSQPQNNAGYNQYDQTGYGNPGEVSMKSKLIDLISAVRTLMRSKSCRRLSLTAHSATFTVPLIGFNIAIIVYELVLGG